jgi:hypothetical protein
VITRPTVLVLGAGASIPYGFPSGLELKDQLVQELGRQRTADTPFRAAAAVTQEQLDEFVTALRYSGQPSVDSFLAERPRFEQLGKLAIAQLLIPAERGGDLYTLFETTRPVGQRRAGDWYKHLFQILWETGPDRFSANNLTIVTLNYDRSLEHYLFTCFQNSSGFSDPETATALAGIPILHLYGSLGPLPWQVDSPTSPGLPYNSQVSPDTLNLASRSLRLLGEGPASETALDLVRGKIEEAHRIHILGFGFHQDSIHFLGLDDIPQPGPVGAATAYGLHATQRSHAQQTLRGKWRLAPPDTDCLDLRDGAIHVAPDSRQGPAARLL